MKNVFNLCEVKNWKGALAFYFAFLIIPVIIIMISGMLIALALGITDQAEAQALGIRFGQISAIVFILVLGVIMLKKRHVINDFTSIMLVLLAAVLSVFIGLIGGLVPLAYLTTRPLGEGNVSDEQAPAEPTATPEPESMPVLDSQPPTQPEGESENPQQ